MVLNSSMATTTNNIQGDEPRPTVLKRQIQTLTAAVEHLTRQNQTLEEQLQQKNAVMGNQEEDQEGASADHRNQEGPDGSNASKRPDVSWPFVADMALPHIVEEMQMMKE